MSVSTVIPAYNAEAFIHKAIESVLNQTTPVDEIIVVDDGSRDRTRAVVESYGGRVRLISQQNQGPSPARNLGVRSATSDLIAFLDADDAWHPQKIEKQLAALADAPNAILCYTGLLNLNVDGSQCVRAASPLKALRSALRIYNPGLTPSCVMLSRAAFLQAGGFNSSQKVCEDWDLWLRLLQIGPFCVVDEPLTLYQVSNTGLSSNAEELYEEALRMIDRRLLTGLRGLPRWLWRRRILSYQAYKSALTARASQQRSTELRYIVRSILSWPSPLWQPHRFKALVVTLTNRIRS